MMVLKNIPCCPKKWEHLRKINKKDGNAIESLKTAMKSGNQKLVVAGYEEIRLLDLDLFVKCLTISLSKAAMF